VRCTYVWGGKECGDSFSWGHYSEAAILWLLRAHWFEKHGGKAPEGLP
jgi:hypothetical protein